MCANLQIVTIWQPNARHEPLQYDCNNDMTGFLVTPNMCNEHFFMSRNYLAKTFNTGGTGVNPIGKYLSIKGLDIYVLPLLS